MRPKLPGYSSNDKYIYLFQFPSGGVGREYHEFYWSTLFIEESFAED